ncbi:MAG: SDR family oxidoreductase [Candidatus Sumerlaeaceae bacterium]|nr:SDR family oxidoreductase [Candidatus Sumerlaeaceae bacterium]
MDIAVITGASMGLGEEFARQLAARGENLLLTARSADRLAALAAELAPRHGVQVLTLPLDLAQPGAPGEVARFLEHNGLRPKWLINNAGFGEAGDFMSLDPQRLHECVMLNAVALTDLTRRLLPAMCGIASGARVINVASTAAFQPLAFFAVYAATKAYVLHLSEALHEELRPAGVRVTCLCPGPTRTQFAHNNGLDPRFFEHGQTASEVVRQGLAASDRGQALCITQTRLRIALSRLAPRSVVRKVAAAVARSLIQNRR